jgi:trans-aconitate methyltransferase
VSSDSAPRMYTDLAPWWPLISPPDEYVEEAAEAARHLRAAAIPVRDVLELGSGGGNNAVHLSEWFTMTLVDLNAAMLEVSRALNPGCEHVVGDMRTVRLDRTFDAVFVHDAVCYLLTEDDVLACLVTAREHCRPGGIVVVVPDETAESWVPDTDHAAATTPTAAAPGTSRGTGIPTRPTPRP